MQHDDISHLKNEQIQNTDGQAQMEGYGPLHRCQEDLLESIVLQGIVFKKKVWLEGPQQKKGSVMAIGKIGDRSMKKDK